jgi:hypothetical protein
MNWLTWRQYRSQALAGYGALAAMGAFLIFTGWQILDAYRTSGLARCLPVGGQECFDLSSAFSQRYSSMQFFVLFLLAVPVLVGMFWGAPLVARELEQGTHRLAWTQSVTRGRWIASKLAIIGASTLAFSAILALAVWWWSRPLVATGWNSFEPGIFDLRGIVPVAYTMFAVALGVALGALMRKTLPAVFTTLAVFVAVRLVLVLFVRKHYVAAKTLVFGLDSTTPHINHGDDWILSSNMIDRAGNVVSNFGGLEFGFLARQCPELARTGPGGGKGLVAECVQRIGLRTSEIYHPADRYWTFQAIEAAIFLALTALLVVYIVRRVKRVA